MTCLQLLLLLTLALCYPTAAAQNTYPDAAETPVQLLPLAAPLNTFEAEISGLDWCQNELLLLPQYPEFAEELEKVNPALNLYSLDKAAILAAIESSGETPLQAKAIKLIENGIREQVDHFDGYEAVVCYEDQMWLTIEEDGKHDNFHAWMVRANANLGSSQPTIELQADSLIRIEAQVNRENMGVEALLLESRDDAPRLIGLYELNSARNVDHPVARWFEEGDRGEYPMPDLPYRITDATALDSAQRFWAVNYLYEDDDFLFESSDPLFLTYGIGATHRQEKNVERLLELELHDGQIRHTGRAPILLQLSGERGRNWEGIVRLDDLGLLIVTDRYPKKQTYFGFVPFGRAEQQQP